MGKLSPQNKDPLLSSPVNERNAEKSVKKTIKKMSKTKIKKKCDDLRSEIIKILAGFQCEFVYAGNVRCGRIGRYLNSHHVFSRSNHSVRRDIKNGVALCPRHHLLSTLSAHQSPVEFIEWLKEYRGEKWYEKLRLKAKTPAKKIDLDEIYEQLLYIKKTISQMNLEEDVAKGQVETTNLG